MPEGEQFIAKKYPDMLRLVEEDLRALTPVEHEQERRRMLVEHGIKGEKPSQKPADKIANFLAVIERTHLGHRDDPMVMERIKSSYHQEHVIKAEDIPQHFWNTQAQIMIREGRLGDMEKAGVKKEESTGKDGQVHTNYLFPEDLQKQQIEVLQANQRRSLDQWLDYLTSVDAVYPMWAKYWVFRSVLGMGKFEKIPADEEQGEGVREKARFQKRGKDTVSSFPLLNPRALALAIGVMSDRLQEKQKPKKDQKPIENVSKQLADPEFQKLLSTENFAKLYAQFLVEIPEYTTEGLKEIRGEWVKYEQDMDPGTLVKSLEGYPLEWCTADPDTARIQLENGDFYIYYSFNEDGEAKIPRLAIRMEGQNKIAEPPRGIAPDQNLDPYIGPVLEKKMADFGKEGELYKKRVKHMEKLTAIWEKNKAGEELNQADLIFLYEIDEPIEGFGYEKDLRIKELRDQRKPEEDAPIVLGCAKEEIAYSATEINESTKAYIGPLFPNIFRTLKHPEHIYTSFPESKIKRSTIEIGGKTKEELIEEMTEQKIQITPYAKFMMENSAFTTVENPEPIDLVRLKVKDLGFTGNLTTEQIYRKAAELGLELCPAEVGPRYRLNYTDQATGEYFYIGMKHIADLDGLPHVFLLSRYGDGLWLDNYWARPDDVWALEDEFVFRLRNCFLSVTLQVTVFFVIFNVFLPTVKHLSNFFKF